MPLPIAGEIEVTVAAAAPVSIHGDLYVDLAMLVPGDATPTRARVPASSFPVSSDGERRLPAVDDRLVVRVLLGQVDGVRPAD
ncbi:MAG: hypothetical protein CMJ52_11210 [Planctomycetaceae bacterium]|nr:hypothetical protein [Planctomycetaceae bacterium]